MRGRGVVRIDTLQIRALAAALLVLAALFYLQFGAKRSLIRLPRRR